MLFDMVGFGFPLPATYAAGQFLNGGEVFSLFGCKFVVHQFFQGFSPLQRRLYACIFVHNRNSFLPATQEIHRNAGDRNPPILYEDTCRVRIG